MPLSPPSGNPLRARWCGTSMHCRITRNLCAARLEAEEDEGTREVIEYRVEGEITERTIRSIRQHYVHRFIHEAARLRAEHRERVYNEAALRRADGEIAREGQFQLGMRVDAVIPTEGKTVRIDSVSVLRFEPTTVQL